MKVLRRKIWYSDGTVRKRLLVLNNYSPRKYRYELRKLREDGFTILSVEEIYLELADS